MAKSLPRFKYLLELAHAPKAVGSVAESSSSLSRRIAREIDLSIPGTIVELGPGPGALTAGLLEAGLAPERLLLIEFNPRFVAHLERRFPGVEVVCGDAWEISSHLAARRPGTPCPAVVSGLPLLNFPPERRNALMAAVGELLTPSRGRFVQFSYGPKAPVAAPDGVTLSRSEWIWANVPPARVWTYRFNGGN